MLNLYRDDEYAYHIITNCTMPYIPNNNPNNNRDLNLVIKISSDITQDQIEILTKATKEVLGSQTNLTFKEKNKEAISNKIKSAAGEHKTNPVRETTNLNLEPKTTIPCSPLWQKIRNILKQRFGDKGEALDKSWFAKLDIELQVREETKKEQIKIKCPNSFVRSWIRTNYGSAVEDAMESAIEHTTKQFVEVEYVTC